MAAICQTRVIIGTVLSEEDVPLERANVMAKAIKNGEGMTFAVANEKGHYRLELQSNVVYELSVSYIGYQKQSYLLAIDSNIKEHHFKLLPDIKQLDEIVINYNYTPVEIKKDTITFHVEAFTSGDERKLKEVLEKLPGVEVDENGQIRFQGNPVNQTLVENKKFFGGGSRLAVENLPADAIGEIEMISHFSEVDFMKEILNSDELAMNVKLKSDKKNLVFGDIEVASGPKSYYLGHTGLFYFSPQKSISLIGDINNTGKAAFTMDDVLRLQGGISSYLSESSRPSLSNLTGFALDKSDLAENTSKFISLNGNSDISRTINLSGFGILSSQLARTQSNEFIEYLTNETQTDEFRQSNGQIDDLMGLVNLKLEHNPNRYQKGFYNGQVQWGVNKRNALLSSLSNMQENNFDTQVDSKNFSLKQYIEWHKSYSAQHTVTFVINHTLDNLSPHIIDWNNDEAFLTGLIPLVNDTRYHIQQVREQKSNNVNALFKHYWILNRHGQLTSNIGSNFTKTEMSFSDKQLLSNGEINDFTVAGFGNHVNYKLNDTYVGLDYRLYIKKLTSTISLYAHWYHLNVLQTEKKRKISRLMLEPALASEYEFSASEKISLKYALRNTFPSAMQVSDRFSLSAYNAVASGNALLENERYHTSNLRYHKFETTTGTNVNAQVSMNRKIRTIRNELAFDGINQYRRPVLTDNPETNVSASVSYEKKFKWLIPSASFNLSWFHYSQTIDEIAMDNTRTNHNVTLGVRIIEKNRLPHIILRYTKGRNQFNGTTTTRFETDRVYARINYRVLPSWTVEGSFDYFRNNNISTLSKNVYQIINTGINFQKANSAWGISFTMNNLLDNRFKVNNSISDFLISEQITYILPRIFLLGISHKL